MAHFQISPESVWSGVTGFSLLWVLRAAGRGASTLTPCRIPSCLPPTAQPGHPGVLPPIALAKQAVSTAPGAAAQPGGGDRAQPQPCRSPARRSALPPGTQMDPCPHLLGTASLSASPVKHFPLYKFIMTHHYFTIFFPYFYQLHSLV